ncbi:hypothetical protein NEOLEDRAFT_1142982 [Neolentinus lepideus HHB14362 ss-1]|uniref:Uncharacterized protein n=1 Tax=Neolentinus lepideus HHB14362 ss-1 TaxID=1314782 RepID=A0A165MT13_9AGAM|nr:hypothetical protein NEOLEDRAFT_1142982 [Neolentinus lepideus HHB14362 ss-1]
MASLTYSQCNILELWFMTLLYGAYVVIFFTSMYTIRTGSRRIGKPLIYTTIALFILSTAQTICILVYTLLTLTYDLRYTANLATLPAMTIKTLEHDQNVINLYQAMSDSMIATTNLIADGLLIWRCFVVWGRSFWIIALPIAILVAGSVCGYGVVVIDVIWYLKKVHHPMLKISGLSWDRLVHLETSFTKGFLIMSAATNILMSFLIAGRILCTVKNQIGYGYAREGKKYKRLVYLMIESGSIYSLSLLLSGVLYSAGYTASGSIVLGMQYQLVGIFPTLIILLVTLGKTVDQTDMAQLSGGRIEFSTNPARDIESAMTQKVSGPEIEVHVVTKSGTYFEGPSSYGSSPGHDRGEEEK